ncbi:MAG: hypothetical protein ACPGVD_12805 [Flavobacteriales bacterium]
MQNNESNSIRDRFSTFLAAKKLSQSKFARLTGYEQKNVSSFLTKKVKFPRIDLVVVLAKYFPELNLRWLLLGEGEMWVDPSVAIDKTSIQVLLKNQAEVLELLKAS